jgi:hypothetical protein
VDRCWKNSRRDERGRLATPALGRSGRAICDIGDL